MSMWRECVEGSLRLCEWRRRGVAAGRGRADGSVSSVTRIVAGQFGGRRLVAPTGGGTRPTSERVREGLFSTLESLTDLAGARFADLYAGSGVVGLEACSRGADHVLLVESDPRAVRAARANITALGVADRVRLLPGRVGAVLAAGADAPYDVVFADPPYALADAELTELQAALLAGGWLAPDAVVVIERTRRSGPLTWVESITADRTRRYGDTVLWYGRRS